MLGEHTGSDLGVLLHELVHRVGCDFWSRVGKVHECLESWIGLPQHSVAVSGNDTSRLEDFPEEVVNILFCEIGANRLLHIENEAEHFLRSQTV
jgi:hypothetical protein